MNRTRRTRNIIITTVLVFMGFAIRASFIIHAEFPLNDGGFFLSMIRDLQAAGGALPVYATYNHSGIPYAYPPLAFYLVDFVARRLSISVLTLLTYLPIFFSCLTLLAFLPLAKEFLKDDREYHVAVMIYAFFLPGFIWSIMGGGLTRALGLTFALLSITFARKLYVTGETRYAIPCAIASTLTVLSHPNLTWFAVLSIGLLFLLEGLTQGRIIHSAFVVMLVVLFTAPWWATVLRNHGIGPVIEAFSTESYEWDIWNCMLRYAAFGGLGIIVCIRSRDISLPVWFFLLFLLDPRNAPTVAVVPLSMLFSIGFWRLIHPSWQRIRKNEFSADPEESRPDDAAELGPMSTRGFPTLRRVFDRVIVILAVFMVLGMGLDYWDNLKPTSPIQALDKRELEMMAWIEEEIPADRAFLILSADIWWNDKIAEWFPSLTGHRSLLTAQGHEWLSADLFSGIWKSHTQVQGWVRGEDLASILEWQSESGEKPEYLYYSTTRTNWVGEYRCCEGTEELLLQSPALELVHREGETMLFKINE